MLSLLITFITLTIQCIHAQSTTVTIPLSEPTPQQPITQVPGLNFPLPQICQNNRQYTTCTNKATNDMAKCQSQLDEIGQMNSTFYACLCTGMKDYLDCFNLCPDDPQLTAQKPYYEQSFRGQCTNYAQIVSESISLSTTTSSMKPTKTKELPPATDPPVTATASSIPTSSPLGAPPTVFTDASMDEWHSIMQALTICLFMNAFRLTSMLML